MSQELEGFVWLLSLTMLMFTHDWRWAGWVSGLYDGVKGWTVSLSVPTTYLSYLSITEDSLDTY